MTMDQTDISISINGKTHRIDIKDPEGIRQIPWEDRKHMIAVLDAIRQAEHVKQPSQPDIRAVAPIKTANQTTGQTTRKPEAAAHNKPEDIDVLMSQLIIEDRKNQTQIPDRVVVIKWMLLIFAVIVLLSLLF
jgi:hypothetical protein